MARQSEDGDRFRELRDAYDSAFLNWTIQRDLLQQLTESGSAKQRRTELLKQIEAAENHYIECRNQLADYLMSSVKHDHHLHTEMHYGSHNGRRRQEVELAAYKLWERAGRPLGSAESDWYTAERLVMTGR